MGNELDCVLASWGKKAKNMTCGSCCSSSSASEQSQCLALFSLHRLRYGSCPDLAQQLQCQQWITLAAEFIC